MLTVYLAALVIGGVFVLLSAIGGSATDKDYDKDFDKDLDKDFDKDFDKDLDKDFDKDFDADGAEAGHSDLWLPFLSMRFWTWFLAFFGLTGALLSWLWQEGLATGLLSTGMGLVCGLGMAYSTRYLKKQIVHSGLGHDDLVGCVGDVIVSVTPGQVGQVRCSVKGQTIDILARAEDGDSKAIPRGTKVMIIEFEGATARVAAVSDLERVGAPAEVERSQKGA